MWDNIKMDLHDMDGEHGLDGFGSEQGQLRDTCKGSNEPSGSIKCGEFLNWLKINTLLKKDSAS